LVGFYLSSSGFDEEPRVKMGSKLKHRHSRLSTIAILAMSASIIGLSASAEGRVSSNGVLVTIDSDEFRPFVDYTPPAFEDGENRYVFVIRKKASGDIVYMVQGSIRYRDEWRRYDRAYLPGGEPVEFVASNRDVVSCGDRYSPCLHSESYQLKFTQEQLASGVAGGALRVQVSGSGGGEFIVHLPGDEVLATAEVAGVPLELKDATPEPEQPDHP
jgi:hypothetical protein